MAKLHEVIRLISSHEYFTLEAHNKENNEKSYLYFNRATGAVVPPGEVRESNYNPATTVDDIHGVIGIVKLLAGPYLLVITGRRLIGKINGADIWKITSTKLLPFHREGDLTMAHYNDELRYRRMIECAMATDGIYFSYSYDLTHSLQKVNEAGSANQNEPLYKKVDPRFWWNGYVAQDLVAAKLDPWILPIMMGFVEIHQCQINNKSFDFILIGRRNIKRVGTRYFVRGIDKEGNVANAVETEQIIVTREGARSSLVQTRGSIPLFWTQTPSLKYKPKLNIYGQEIETPPAFRRHFQELSKHYNKIIAINLIDQKGSELLLGNAYESEAKKNTELKYVAFDFHHQCRNMRWDRLSLLMDQIQDDVEKNGFFFSENGKVQKTQQGIFRTNCIDNLDRTNVVQSLIARKSLSEQFALHKIFSSINEKIESHSNFEYVFKNVWANHADTVSLQYSGTGALKTDFTRTGKRTLQGALNDGINSLTRYYLNNFSDGFRQDSYDLFLGNFVPSVGDPSPFKQQGLTVAKMVLAAVGVFALGLLLPHEYKLMFTVGFVLLAVAGTKVLTMFGKRFVDKPLLYLKEHKL